MKRNFFLVLALAVIDLALTIFVWLKWGGLHNDMGTMVCLWWLCITFTILADKAKKIKPEVKD